MAMVGGWKKNFLRRKQQADQLIGRAEKSEVISDYQQEKEKRAETIRQVCKTTRQKLGEYVRVNDGEFEKRLKKMPEYGLSQSMLESAAALAPDSLLGSVFQSSSGAAETIAREHVEMLVSIENEVYKPMQEIENEVKGIVLDKKHLNNVTLDMDGAKNRYHSAMKQMQNTGASKLDGLRDEMEEAATKVEHARDTFATNLYSFATKEPEHSKLLIKWAEAQKKFHTEALKQIEKLIPDLEKCIESHEEGGVYGVSLQDHLHRSNRKIAYVMEVCIPALYALGLHEEGLFRIAGGQNKVRKLKAALDCRHDFVDLPDEFEDGRDVHTIAGALKLYLRELPQPLMTCESYDRWMAAAKSTGDQRLKEFWEVIYSLPKENFDNLGYLIKFLGKLAQHQDVNKMTPSNLAIVFGPNLLWPPSGGGPTVLTTGIQSAIVETLITNADWFFPEDVDFRKDGRGSGTDGQRSKAPASAGILAQKTLPRSSHSVNSAMTSFHNTLMAPMSQAKSNSSSAPVSRETSPGLKNSLSGPPPLGPGILSTSQEEKSNSSSPPSQPSGLHGSSNHGNSTSSSQDVSPSPRLSNKDIRERFLEGKPVGAPPVPGAGKSSPEQTVASRSEWQRRSWSEARPSPYISSNIFNGSNTSNLDSITRPKDKSDTFSDPGFLGSSTLGRSSARRSLLSRATTPPPKPPPPKGVHSDVYNTVFALQSLGDGWSDYLTRVRTLLDSSLTKSGSSDSEGSATPTSSETGGLSSSEQKSSEPCESEPKTDTASTSSSSSISEAKLSSSSGSVGAGLGPKAGDAPQDNLQP